MKERILSGLSEALRWPLGPHLAEETIAELASAEAAGEDIDRLYPSAVAHVESCLPCAEAYGELAVMMLAAIDDMAAAAARVKPQEVLASILLADVEARAFPSAQIPELVRAVVENLPPLFAALPASAADISAAAIAAVIEKVSPPVEAAHIAPALTGSLRRHLAALSLFLTNLADSVWGSVVEVKTGLEEAWQVLRFQPGPEPAVPTMGERAAGPDWQLTSQQVGHPIPFNVTARAERTSPLACRVTVSVDRPGLPDPSGRLVQLHYADQTLRAKTDLAGMARFESVPIAVLPESEIRFQS